MALISTVVAQTAMGADSPPAQPAFTRYPVSNGVAQSIITGPDGNLWFVEGSGLKIARMTPGGVVTGEFPITGPVSTDILTVPVITVGPDGNLWFSRRRDAAIGRITPLGVMTQFDTQIPGTITPDPWGITAGPDGNLWFTESILNNIGRITPAGAVTRFSIPGKGNYYGGTRPLNITAGPDGNVWFTQYDDTARIGRITPAGVITEFPVPGGVPYDITLGPDGNLWFTDSVANKIGRITPAGFITEFLIPTSGNWPLYITTGPDGNLWFTENSSNKLGRITVAGEITEFSIPFGIGGGAPTGITAGPDGNLWFGDGPAIVKANIPGGTQSTIAPNVGGNTGNVTVQIFGRWQTGAMVKFTGFGSDIVGTNPKVSNGLVLSATFDLTGALPGVRTIVIMNPDGTSVSLPSAFTIQQGGGSNILVGLIGRSGIRGARSQVYFVSLANIGDNDSGSVIVSLTIPRFVSWQDSPDQPIFELLGTSSTRVLVVGVAKVPAGGSVSAPLILTVPDSPSYAHQNFAISAKHGTSVQLDTDNAVLTKTGNSLHGFTLAAAATANPALNADSDVSLETILSQKGLPFLPFSCTACSNEYLDQLNHHVDSLLLYNQWQQARVDTDTALTNLIVGAGGAVASAVAVFYLTGTLATLIPATVAPADVLALRTAIGATLGLSRDLAQNAILGRSSLDNNLTTLRNNSALMLASSLRISQVIQQQPSIDPTGALLDLLGNIQTKLGFLGAGVNAVNVLIDPFYEARLHRDDFFAAFNTSLVPYGQAQQLYQACRDTRCGPQPPQQHPSPSPGPDAELVVQIVTSGDPNDKVGNQGAGPGHYLSGDQSLNYSIYFDNVPAATAPAQKVVVMDQLNPVLVDIPTLTLGLISFVDKLVSPPAVPLALLGSYTTDVDLRPTTNLIVRINVALNQGTGLLTWTYTSLDPATGQLTTDPFAGFLPAGTEGSVSFNVAPKPPIASNTRITNKATIVFDVNPSIDTPVWLNTIDKDKPTSHVLTLSATAPPSFSVQWSGADVGSGIASFTVFASDNGGPYAPWLTGTTDSQGTYPGEAGHTYAFYSIARDLVGNLENTKSAAEATTQVLNSSCAADSTSSVGITRGGFRLNNTTQRYVQSIALKNTSITPITGPISLVLDGLSANATLFGANGVTACAAPLGSPFFNLSVSGGTLAPGATATASLQFTNPSNQGITYSTRILSGAGTR